MFSGIHCRKLEGISWHVLQGIAGHSMVCAAARSLACCRASCGRRGQQAHGHPAPPLGSSPTWEPGAPRGPGGPGRAWGRTETSEPCAQPRPQPRSSPLPTQLPSPHVAPDARGKDFPCSVSSPAELICLVLPQGEGEFGATKRWQTALTLGPAFPGNPGRPRAPVSPCWEEKRTKPHTKTPNPNPSFLSRVSTQ